MLQSIPISKTKIVVPNRRSEILLRPRLLERLKGLIDNKLVLLSAPAGYGKTSLLVDLAHNVQMPVCWLSLDLLDRDPQRFIAYLIASLAESFPGIGAMTRVQLSQLNSLERDAENLLVTLTNEIYDQAEEDFLLIIDDFHLLDETPEIPSLLNRFLELVVENCHIILSSRTLPTLDDVTLMVAREQVAGLNHAELAFLPREVQALYAQNYHQHLSDETASQFVQQTGGWITGMVLSNLPGMPRISGVDTFSYLGQQVLDIQPPHVREFLMQTSLPEEFNAEFCEIILGPLHPEPQNWSDLMGLIFERNLFVLPLEDGRWLRYHPLFREFLQTRLKKERPHQVRPILERMVKAYEKANEWAKAYFTCTQLRDVEALAGVIERAGTPMLQNAAFTLEGWINSLPPPVQTRPGLISLRGAILTMKGNLQEAKELLDKSISIYRKNRETNGLVLALIRRANALRMMGDYSMSLADVQEALRLSEKDSSFQAHYAEALRLKGLNLYRLGESRQAVEALEHSRSLYSALNDASRLPTLLMEIGMVHGAVGDIEAARSSYQSALKIRELEQNLYAQAEILNNLAVLYHQTGDYELASETFEFGLVCARKGHNRRTEALILAGLGDLYGEVEIFEAAWQAYQQSETVSGNLPRQFISNYLMIARGTLALAQGNLTEVSRTFKLLQKKKRNIQSTYERGLWELLEGRYFLYKKEPQKAISRLKDCKELFARDGRNMELRWSAVWLTAAYESLGERELASAEIQGFLPGMTAPSHALLVSLRQASPWLKGLQTDPVIGRPLNRLIEKVQRMNAKLPAIRRTLRRQASFIQASSVGLVIRAFGNPEVSVNGRVVTMPEWRTQSVRDLFFYFLYRQEAVTKEQVGTALWPETRDAPALKKRFKNEIYRLRRAVGRDVIVFDDEYYRFNSEMDYEYDVEAFDSHLLRARKTANLNNRLMHLQNAVDMFQGPYLEDVNSEWAVPERERLAHAYTLALEELSYRYLNTNQLEHCLTVCQMALQRDRFHEVIYQIEMRAYAASGDRSAVVRRYQACKTAMQDLGISPSEETERIFRELTGG